MSGWKRGNLLWESSRMFLPEHKEALLARKRKEQAFHPPDPDEERLREIDRIIRQSIECDRAVTITYADPYQPRKFWGWVKKVDVHERRIKLVNDEETLLLSFDRILGAEME